MVRRLLRLGVALATASAGLIFVTAGSSEATPITVIDCDTPVTNPPVSTPDPDGGGPAPGIPLLSGNANCAELARTLVFVGNANIDNGVNFNGVGGTSPGTYGTPINATGGGTYKYTGDCVMVNWEDPRKSSVATVSPVPNVVDCGFNTVNGQYYPPHSGDPIVNNIFDPISGNMPTQQLKDATNWGPNDQASCAGGSSGEGTADFTSTNPIGGETWTSSYTWQNSLRNLRGTISNGSASYLFDAKIEAHSNPVAAMSAGGDGALDATDAGCLQKPLANLTSSATNARTGNNDILIVGTATWDLRVPQLFHE